MGVQGMGGMEAGTAQPFLPIAPTPWRFFGFFLGVQKETRRRGGGISLPQAKNSIIAPSSAPVCALGHLSSQGEGFRAAQVCRPYREREGFRAVRTPPLQKKTGLEKTAGRPLRGTKMGGFSKPCSGVRSPCAYFFENGAPGTARGRGKGMPPQKMVTFCATLRKYFKEILLCNNPDALLRFCYTFL